MNSNVKLIANAPKPRMVCINSLKVLGTSSDTTNSVIANPKTASLRPSVREISWLRQRNFLLSPMPLSISFSLIISFLKGLLPRCQRRFNYALEFCARLFTIADKALYQLPVAIKHERLRDILIVAEKR